MDTAHRGGGGGGGGGSSSSTTTTFDLDLGGIFYSNTCTLAETKKCTAPYYTYEQKVRKTRLQGKLSKSLTLQFVDSVLVLVRLLMDNDDGKRPNVKPAGDPMVIVSFLKSVIPKETETMFQPEQLSTCMDEVHKLADFIRKETSEIWFEHWKSFDADVVNRLLALTAQHKKANHLIAVCNNVGSGRDCSRELNSLLEQTLALIWLVGEQSLLVRMLCLVLEIALLGTLESPNESHHIKLYILNQMQRIIVNMDLNKTFTLNMTLKLNQLPRRKKHPVTITRSDHSLARDDALKYNRALIDVLSCFRIPMEHGNVGFVGTIFAQLNDGKYAIVMKDLAERFNIDQITLSYVLCGVFPSHVLRFKYYCKEHLNNLRRKYGAPAVDCQEIKDFYSVFPRLFDTIVDPDFLSESKKPEGYENPNHFQDFNELYLIQAATAISKMIPRKNLPKDPLFHDLFENFKNLLGNSSSKS